MVDISYDVVSDLDPKELHAFYAAQGHPAPSSSEKLAQMIRNSVSFVTARTGDGKLIGIARGISDGVQGYLTECKLDPHFQGPAAVTGKDGRIEHDQYGIARAMAERVLQALSEMGCERIDCSAYGTEVDFCEELGFKKSAGQVPMSLDSRRLAPLMH